MGYDAIELGCTAPHAWPEFLDTQQRSTIRKLAKKNHINFSTLLPVTGPGPGNNPASGNEKERRWITRHLLDICDFAHELECKKILYVAGFFIHGDSKDEAWNYSLECLQTVARYAQGKGISMIIEPTSADSNLVESIDDALLMKRQSGLSNVEVMFDTFHAFYRSEQPVEHIYRLGTELSHLHISDYDRMGPGAGGFDFSGVMQALKDTGFDGYITLEAGFTERRLQPFDIARRSIEYLKNIEKNLK